MPAGIPSVTNPAVGEIPLLSETRSKGSWLVSAVPPDAGAASCREHPVTQAAVPQAKVSTAVNLPAHRHFFMNCILPVANYSWQVASVIPTLERFES
jgi:hypothetical protein